MMNLRNYLIRNDHKGLSRNAKIDSHPRSNTNSWYGYTSYSILSTLLTKASIRLLYRSPNHLRIDRTISPGYVLYKLSFQCFTPNLILCNALFICSKCTLMLVLTSQYTMFTHPQQHSHLYYLILSSS